MRSLRSVFTNGIEHMSPLVRALVLLVVGSLLGILGEYVYTTRTAVTPNLTEVRANAKDYQFINPLLFYKSSPDPDYAYIQKKTECVCV